MVLNVGILVSGRGSNMQAIIEANREGRLGVDKIVVLSDNPDAPALDKANALGVEAIYIPVKSNGAKLTPEEEDMFVKELKDRDVGLVCLAGFMRIISHGILREYEGRIINIHPSLLPSFRGLNVHERVLEYGCRYTGCTVHFVTADVDAGPIILQACVPVRQDDTPETLAERVLREEHRIYPMSVRLFSEGRLSIEGRRVIIEGWEDYE
ncbi:MAG TPA: phosphoribosylglycinamide formyltransferase [Firmicutes bacterium]|nr:MAG: phosphoribosylglycinamide formyltransferase [Candidatus Coatesbacteria bacterium]RLC42791.1 MAG: phosphoribosylglycinamide formyltransferase [Candidatus Coatesbacteria bacterium]RLC45095.1 MAG: phosphoribosylglycinamide formyltransferase [Candidatus Coatesbacteria bacterium]HDM43047.1 phosphoribosylglycinamide formyltransferase [Bacillota bacterium]